jgi:Holliday junction DNA helicase RuvA
LISFLSGQLIDETEGVITLLCRGVGYEVHCSSHTLGDIADRKVVQLWIHSHVREDQFSLFGFSSKIEKKLFLNLIKVNGIGPKLATQILSGASLDHIIDAIEEKNVKALTALPRIGKKTAEQMILTLKGALVVDKEESLQRVEPRQAHKEILSALTNLGFRSAEVEEVVQALPQDVDFEQGVRDSLRRLSQ